MIAALGTRPPELMCCPSQERAPQGGLRGRVTDCLACLSLDPTDSAFYVCAASAMVADCKVLPEARGALRVFIKG